VLVQLLTHLYVSCRLCCRVAASFVSQLLVTNEEGRTNFNVPPFLLTYLSTSVFTVFLPLVQLKSLLQETWLLRSAQHAQRRPAKRTDTSAATSSSCMEVMQQSGCAVMQITLCA
jgi:hypothetical protein